MTGPFPLAVTAGPFPLAVTAGPFPLAVKAGLEPAFHAPSLEHNLPVQTRPSCPGPAPPAAIRAALPHRRVTCRTDHPHRPTPPPPPRIGSLRTTPARHRSDPRQCHRWPCPTLRHRRPKPRGEDLRHARLPGPGQRRAAERQGPHRTQPRHPQRNPRPSPRPGTRRRTAYRVVAAQRQFRPQPPPHHLPRQGLAQSGRSGCPPSGLARLAPRGKSQWCAPPPPPEPPGAAPGTGSLRESRV